MSGLQNADERAARDEFRRFLNRWRGRLPADVLERLIDARDRTAGVVDGEGA